jgi:hypothetical protein
MKNWKIGGSTQGLCPYRQDRYFEEFSLNESGRAANVSADITSGIEYSAL